MTTSFPFTAARFVLAVIFILFGANGFFRFLPVPDLSEDGSLFIMLLVDSGFMYVVKGIEVVGGLLLLGRRFRSAGLAMLAPVATCIFLFHLFLDEQNLLIGMAVIVLWALAYWPLREQFAEIFSSSS